MHGKADGRCVVYAAWRSQGTTVYWEGWAASEKQSWAIQALAENLPLWQRLFLRRNWQLWLNGRALSDAAGYDARWAALRRCGTAAAMPACSIDLPENYARTRGLVWQPEATCLRFVGEDVSGRPVWLRADAAAAFARLREAAAREHVCLQLVSGFRSAAYQARIFRRKLERGMPLEQILQVNAAPGYSEHHTGRALDLTAPGCPPADAAFEHTPAFAWLVRHASRYGFHLSYPRGNHHGIDYEPWHWCHALGEGPLPQALV